MDENHIAIPSLLAVSAVQQYLVRTKKRTAISIILESAEPRDVHHFATLFGYGASAVNPYLAQDCIGELIAGGALNKDYYAAVDAYNKAILDGVMRIASKMGISSMQSYEGAQIFEAVGICKDVVDRYFTNTVSRVGGIGLQEINEAVLWRHDRAYDPMDLTADLTVDSSGFHKLRSGSDMEDHMYNPLTILTLQQAVRTGDFDCFRRYSAMVDDEQLPHTLRGLLGFRFDETKAIPLSEVEPVSSIVRRFKTGAMSYGSISEEAHRCLAIAMNRLGGKSNSGEGGEEPARLGTEENSAIKQVASGRFGVTSEYLVSAKEIQIKLAQGAKPGEGGQLPPSKVYPWVAEVRITTPGVGLISPPPHHDIYSIEDLAQLIFDLKNANPNARIHVKLVSELGVGTVAAGVSKAHADVVLISGHDGGTGASPLTSLKHAGGPWELGLAETQQTLMLNGLRDRIRVQCDGQLKTGRDVMVAMLLGAEEYGFATAPLVVEGCVMMRVCHLDTCPVGIATQNPELRKKYTGRAEHVVNFFTFIAEEIREYLAELGFRSIDEAVGRVDCLRPRSDLKDLPRAAKLNLDRILHAAESPWMEQDPRCTKSQEHGLEGTLDQQIIADSSALLMAARRGAAGSAGPLKLSYPISNVDRSVGTRLGHEVTRATGAKGLADGSLTVDLTGSAGNSFGAFVPSGVELVLEGDANDFVGKGLSGGRIVVKPSRSAPPTADAATDTIAGNVIGFGATSGEIFIRGTVGERFCVRNSGATAVVEGIGNHGCEYMTGGRVVVLGPVGRNFGAGMSGGIAFLRADGGNGTADGADALAARINPELVDLQTPDADDVEWLTGVIARHRELTGSTIDVDPAAMVKVMPRDYARVLDVVARAEADNLDVNEAIMEAVNNG